VIAVKKTGEGYYLATLTDKPEVLDRNAVYLIRKELIKLMKSHREISLDLKGVARIKPGGLKILQELKIQMDSKKCKLRFINVEASLIDKIDELRKSRWKPDAAEAI
jgi:hypothetical protein